MAGDVDMSCPRMMVFSPQDAFLFEIGPNDVFAASMHEAINGEHSLRLVTTKVLEKEQRILFKDTANKWREYVISGTDRRHQGHQRPFGEYQAVWSLQHDFKLFGVDEVLGIEEPIMAADALRAILSGTSRWVRGTVTLLNTGGAEMIQRNGWEALSILVANWGGEIDATIEVGTHGVTARKIDLYETQGRQNALRRFDYSRDMQSIDRHVDEMPVACRIRPYGKSEKDVDGFNVALTIEEVTPNGEDYVQNDDVVDLLKLPDGNGGWEYPTTNVTNSQIDDPELLLEWAEEVLEEYTLPKVTYSASVNQFAVAGLDAHGVELGDAVQCVDRAFSEEGLRLELRINQLEVDLLNPKLTTITLGDRHTSYVVSISGTISSMKSEMENTSAMAQSSADYLDNLLYNLNQEINANGGYTYITAGQGMRTYDVAVSDPLVGAEANRVTEVKGGTIRIAEKDAQNQWEWRTVFTNGHVAADMVTAVNITAGYIGNAQGGTYWDLDNGIFRIGGPSYLGSKTVTQVLAEVDDSIGGVVVEYAENQDSQYPPASGWGPVAPTWKEGWYIWQRTKITKGDGSIEYSDATCISGREGRDGTSVTILGSYNTLAELQQAHPTGSTGDGYIVSGDLYVWDGSQWLDVGRIQGPAGQNGAGVVISSRSIRYAKSSDGTTPPSSGWEANPVSTVAGEFLWSRTYVMYSDGTDTTTYGVAAHGQDGADGTSVTISRIEYGTSTDAMASPTSWSEREPAALAKGTWLWVKTTYSDSSTATTKSYVGTDGDDGKSVAIQSATKSGDVTTVVLAETDPNTGTTTTKTLTITDGADGTNGTNGLYGYVHTAWANSADGKTDFSTTESAGKSYLGVYTDNTEADSTAYTDYSWSLIKGADGKKGDKGDTGPQGDAARSYSLLISPDTLKRDRETSALSPSQVTVSAYVAVGSGTPTLYMGRYRIEEHDGSGWSTKYTSSGNESSKSYEPSESAQLMRVTLFASGGTTTQLDSQTVPILSDGTNGADGTDGVDGTSPYSVWLTNDSHTFAASSTAALGEEVNTYIKVYKGTTLVRPVTIGTLPTVPTGMSLTRLNNGSTTKDVGLTISATTALTTRSGTIDIPITADGQSFTVTFSWALAMSGENSYAYSLLCAPASLTRSASGILAQGSVVFTSMRSNGEGTPSAYDGRFVISEYDGTNWANKYTSSSNENSKEYSPTSTAKLVRCTLYLAGGTSKILDTQTVPIVSDGAKGDDAYTVMLTNESHTFAGDSSKALQSTVNCGVVAYKGTGRVSARIGTISGEPSGMSTTIRNNGTTSASFDVAVTQSLTTRQGTLDVPVTVDGNSFSLTFSWSLTLMGEKGDGGVGISSITPQYYLSTSETTQTGGSWGTDQPEWESGKYIWTRSFIEWDDGRTEETDPVLANAINKSNSTATDANDNALSARAGLANEAQERESGMNALSVAIDGVQGSMADMETDLRAGIEDAKRYATDYIEYNQSTGELTLGTTDTDVKNVMTYNTIEFRIANAPITYWGLDENNVGTMYVETASVGNYLRFGDFAWIRRDNGNMTLKWLGA